MMTSDSVRSFYDQLSGDYHLISQDWRKGVRWQGEVLDALIRSQSPDAKTVLDGSCGIGTQAIGLALCGYTVRATDLSPDAVARAEREAKAFGVEIAFGVADLRTLDAQVEGAFDVVLACDNSIAHLPTEADLLSAFRAMRAKVEPDGFVLVSLRDYDRIAQERPRATLPVISADGSAISFQTWVWSADGRSYAMTMFLLNRAGEGWTTTTHDTSLRAWQRSEVSAALEQAGFASIHWHFPETSGYYQPVVIARERSQSGA